MPYHYHISSNITETIIADIISEIIPIIKIVILEDFELILFLKYISLVVFPSPISSKSLFTIQFEQNRHKKEKEEQVTRMM